MWRIDNRCSWADNGHPGHFAEKPIAEYFRTNFYLTTSGNFRARALINAMLPFEDIGHAAGWFDAAEISEADRLKIGRTNATNLFRLNARGSDRSSGGACVAKTGVMRSTC
jgi:2,3-dihydroxybenzoate decarboxylase